MSSDLDVIAFYLPQFHPIPENDAAHGTGFTEWTNVCTTAPLFPGHVQPKLPRDLGFYDLRVPETREAQAEMARAHGLSGFCYWHYWMGGGRRLLERPFDEVLLSGRPNFPFALGWANHSWSGKGWMGGGGATDIEQTYPGEDDIRGHYQFLRRAFSDHRYICINEKPLLVVYRPMEIPNCKVHLEFLRELAAKDGFRDLFIVGDSPGDCGALGIDAKLHSGQRHLPTDIWDAPSPTDALRGRKLKKAPYAKVMEHLVPNQFSPDVIPVVLPNWDTAPRLGEEAMIFYNLHPELFRAHVHDALSFAAQREAGERLVFVRAWNEWAEGNYLEPDMEFGDAFLRVLGEEIARHSTCA